MDVDIDPGRLEQTLADLVRIDSTNPALGPGGGAGEEDVASYVAEAMRDIGLEVDYWEPRPGRPNVVGILRGCGGGCSPDWNS